MTTTRHRFDQELAALQQGVIHMGSLAAEAIELALRVLTERNAALVQQVLDVENRVDALNLEIESHAIQLLALQQPMARDLRTIAAVLRIITDIERVSDYATDTAYQAQKLVDAPLFKPLVDIPRMAAVVQKMLHESLQAFVHRDLNLAMEAVREDDQVDQAYRTLHGEILSHIQRDPSVTPVAIALLLIGVYLERVADHITNIGERVWYMETGELKELHQ